MIFLKPSPLTVYLEQYEHLYPGIKIWWEKRVLPDIISGIKTVYRHDRNMDVRALAVFDREQGKLCHLSMDLAVRGTGLGRSMLNQIIREARAFRLDSIWCHAPENIVDPFVRWSGFGRLSDIGSFGRSNMHDVIMELILREVK